MTPATAATRAPQHIAPPGGARIRPMLRADRERIGVLEEITHRSSDPRGFDLARGIRGARWAVAETPKGRITGMVGAVPLGERVSCATSPSFPTIAAGDWARRSPRGPSPI